MGNSGTLEQEPLKEILKGQYWAALAMLKECIDLCPEDEWDSKAYTNQFWQVAYHALFFTHYYMQPSSENFHPWEGHQSDNQNPDGIAPPPEEIDPSKTLPIIPKPYSKAEVLRYWNICEQSVGPAIDAMDLSSRNSGFSWYRVSKLEHQLINLRHTQHHTAQLADRLRKSANIGIRWVGSRTISKDPF